MRKIEELRESPGIWEDDEKTFWVDLGVAFFSGDYRRSKEIVLDSIRRRLPRYKAVSIVVPVWKEISEKSEELQDEIEQSLLLGPSPGLLQVYVETWPDKMDGKVLTERNIREFLNYDGAEKIGLLQSLLPPRFRPQYLTEVRDLFLKDKLGYQDVVVEHLMDQQVLTGDEALIALSKQAMNWPTQHLYVKLVRNSSLDRDILRKVSEGVLLRELTTITEPLIRDLDYPEETVSRIISESFILHASYFELEEVFSIAQLRCRPDDMEKIVKSANYKKLRQKLDGDAVIVENITKPKIPPSPPTSKRPRPITENVKDFSLSHASEDMDTSKDVEVMDLGFNFGMYAMTLAGAAGVLQNPEEDPKYTKMLIELADDRTDDLKRSFTRCGLTEKGIVKSASELGSYQSVMEYLLTQSNVLARDISDEIVAKFGNRREKIFLFSVKLCQAVGAKKFGHEFSLDKSEMSRMGRDIGLDETDVIRWFNHPTENIFSELRQKLSAAEPIHSFEPKSPNGKDEIPLNLIRILHLSDIHLGTKAEAQKYRFQLETDLRKNLNIEHLDYLIISGDTVNHSTPEEYAAALEMVQGVMDRFALPPTRLICVPGNHDLNWDYSESAYTFVPKRKVEKGMDDCLVIPAGDAGILVRDESLYIKRFTIFNEYFYYKLFGQSYPTAYGDQGLVWFFPDHELLFLALNSAWQVDHYYRIRAGINMQALSRALEQTTGKKYDGWLKIAVWHHPVAGREMMNDEFMQLLAVSGFKICLHGHIHEAVEGFYKYDDSRDIHIIGAGTFGAPTREQTTGIPLQYNLLTLDLSTGLMTVETRKKERPDGAWSADARWGDKNNPIPRYYIQFKRYRT